MDKLLRRLDRRAYVTFAIIVLLPLLAAMLGSPSARADDPHPAPALYGFRPVAPRGPAPHGSKPLVPVDQGQPQATPSHGGGYIPLPFDTSNLNNYPDLSAQDLHLAAKWDWREQGKVTPVQDQGPCGACYAFATLGSLESQALIRDGTRYDLSENNLVECNYQQTGCSGGNIAITTNHLSTHGAVQEACDPYDPVDQACNTSCPAVLAATEMWALGGSAVPPTDVLKNWLQQYGPLYIMMDYGPEGDWGQEFNDYDGSYTLYEPMASPNLNHIVLLVGWNDGLSHAGGSGAWIVKNSWGTSWGGTCGYGSEKGYFTIAYGSAGIGADAAVVRDWLSGASAGQLLYHDEAGIQGGIGWTDSYNPYGLARLTPPQSGTATQVEFWTRGPGTVDIALYDTFDGQSPSGLLWQRQGIDIAYAGYHGVKIDTPIAAQAGNDINVQVRFNTTGIAKAVPFDHKGPASPNQSFASLTGAAGTWLDMGLRSPPLDVGIRLRIVSGPVPTATHTPPPTATPTPSHTPGPPTKTPTYGPSPTRMRIRLPMMLRQYTVIVAPTHTPTATPTVDAGEVYIMANSSGFIDEGGGLHVFGEVQNDSGSILKDVRVTVNILDEDMNPLGSQSDYILLDYLLPDGKACFHLYHDPLSGASQFNFDPPDYDTTSVAPPLMVVVDHHASYDAGDILVTGEVANASGHAVRDARIAGALYDDGSRVVGCDYAYLDQADLSPGESSTFEINYTDRDYEDVARYYVQSEADWQ